MKKLIVLFATVALAGVGCGDDEPATADATPTPDAIQTDASPGIDSAVASACDVTTAGPPGEFLYVANNGSASVSVIDPRTCKVVTTIAVGTGPAEMNPSLDGAHVFVSNSDDNTVSVIETATNTAVRTLGAGTRPLHSFWNPDHTKLWINNDGSANVTVITLADLTVATPIGTGAGHGKIAMDENTPHKVYVSNISDGSVSIIDTTDDSIEATVTVGPGPHGMDYSSVSKQVYNCSSGAAAGLDVIATTGASASTVVDRIEPGTRCNYFHFDHSGRFGWAVNRDSDNVTVIDANDDSVVGNVAVGEKPDKVAFFDGDLAVVSNVKSPNVSVINMLTLQELGKVAVGNGHWDEGLGRGHRQVKASLDGKHAYVPNTDDNTITIIEVATRTVRGTIAVGTAPNAMAIAGPGGGAAYPR